MHGKGMFVWKNGQKFEGNYKNDQKEGQGRLQLADGVVVEGTWVTGKLHGKATILNKEGITRVSEWNMGL